MTHQEITAFFTRCEKLDWTYEMSDASNVWQAGLRAETELATDSLADPVLGKIYTRWSRYRDWQIGHSQVPVQKPTIEEFLT